MNTISIRPKLVSGELNNESSYITSLKTQIDTVKETSKKSPLYIN